MAPNTATNCDVSSSSGPHLRLSRLPQLSGLRMDSSPPNRQEGLIPRHGHSDAAAEVTEEERLPKSSHSWLRESRSGDNVRAGRCFLSSAVSLSARWENTTILSLQGTNAPPLILNHRAEKKGKKKKGGFHQAEG